MNRNIDRRSVHSRPSRILCRSLALFAAAFLIFSACGPAPEIPAPRPTSSERNFLTNGAIVIGDIAAFQWIPGKPVTVGTDSFIFEILDPTDAILVSMMITGEGVANPKAGVTLSLTGESGERGNRGYYLRFECGQTYRWHVRQIEGLNMSPWSEEWTFSAATAPRGVPVPTGPADGAEISGGPLTWTIPIGDETISYAYRILMEVSSNPPGRPAAALTESGPLERQTFFTLLPGETYYWQAQAVRYNGCTGAWSARRRFVWRGPVVVGRDSTLPSDASLSAPSPIEDLDSPYETRTPTTTCTLTSTPLAIVDKTHPPTVTPAIFTLPTDSPPPKPTVISCGDYSDNPDKCKIVGCYWWSNNSCNADPEPPAPPACSSYTKQESCEQAKCFWDDKQQYCGG